MKKMVYKNKIIRRSTALTLLEMVIAVAMMVIIFAAILPQLRAIQNSWDSKKDSAETLQNGRILIDHLSRNLSSAVRITAVSDSSETNGYIEFENNDGNDLRYDIGVRGYVEFGPVGDLYDLAGPVSKLQFSCYDGNDFENTTTDVNSIRFVRAETTLTKSTGPAKALTTAAYLRTNSSSSGTVSSWELTKGTNFEFDSKSGLGPALVKIDTNHYLCAYEGDKTDGYAVVLTVNTGTKEITSGTSLEFDTSNCQTPALIQIDSTHYLCVYDGVDSDGFAVVLTVNTGTWEITREGTPYEFETSNVEILTLGQIDSTHYFCAYRGPDSDCWAVVLTVDTGNWTVTEETPFNFDDKNGRQPALAQIDSTHYLCAYYDGDSDGWADVLAVDTGTWAITTESTLEYETVKGEYPALAKIDNNHYLCAYKGPDTDGFAVVLTVDTGNWTISKGAAFEFDPLSTECPALAKIDATHYLCAYKGHVASLADNGWAIILTVDTGNWTVSQEETSLEFDTDGIDPTLAKINDSLFLCAYEGPGGDGWSVVISAEGSGSTEEIGP